MQELVQEGLSNLCRLCGEDDRECFDLFDDERQEEELLLKIKQFIRIAIGQGDGLPTGICAVCHDKLIGYATFYQQCHDTQDRLQEFLSIECAMQKSVLGNQEEEATNNNDDDDDGHNYEAETEEVYYYEEEGPDDGMEDMEVVGAVEAEEAEGSYMITEIHQENIEERRLEAERMMSSPISMVVENLQEMTSTQNTEEEINLECTSISSSKPNTKLVYLIKNAGDIPVESVLSAVLGGSSSQSPPKTHQATKPLTGHKKQKVQAKKRKHLPVDNGASQKVVIKGSDGKENMIFLDLDMPVKVELQAESEDVDDPTWAPTHSDRAGSRSSSWSKLKRARSAVRNSMRTLRLPKPHKKRETRKERDLLHKGSASQRHIIQEDDPNYAIMMEKFAKPVSVSTMKRHGLYRPKTNGYKIDAPYKKDVAPYIEKISDTEYKCKICLTAKFRWNYKAEIHILEHLDWRPFECEVCGRAFTQNQYLTKHKRLHFPDDTNFMCEVCGKGFQRRYYLTYHMDEHVEKTYTCEECGRKFTRRQKHDEHVRYHHKCHYSVCDICGQTLRTTALSRHRKQHGEKSERKKRENSSVSNWLSCNVCGRAFRSVRERDDHEAEHSNSLLPFHCEECAVYFKTKRTLTNHIMHAHSEITGEVCEVAADAAAEEGSEEAMIEEAMIEECEVSAGEEECEVATDVLDELSSTIIVSIPEEL